MVSGVKKACSPWNIRATSKEWPHPIQTTDNNLFRLGRAVQVGAEGGIWTLARFYPPTPLAGEPLRPLGYFRVSKHQKDEIVIWRREWDSNPRPLRVTGFQDRLLKPLGHLSKFRKPSKHSGHDTITDSVCQWGSCGVPPKMWDAPSGPGKIMAAELPFQIMVADALFSKFFVKMPDKVYKIQGDWTISITLYLTQYSLNNLISLVSYLPHHLQ